MENFRDEVDAAEQVLTRKTAKRKYIRKGSKFHRQYPASSVKYPFAFWAGLDRTLIAHRTLLNNGPEGKLVVFYGEPGTGKSSGIQALIHGNTGMKPNRSLTIRFIAFYGEPDEQQVLNELAELLGFPVEEGKDVKYLDLATFIVDAVKKDEKRGIAAAQSFSSGLASLWESCTSMCGAKATLESEDDQLPRPMDILAIPDEYRQEHATGQTKPIIVIDDVNRVIESNGVLANFFYTLGSLCHDQNVICYVITQNRLTAYRIWQMNGGNWIAPHQAVSQIINPIPASIADWAKGYESELTTSEVKSLRPEKIPNFHFPKDAFVPTEDEKKDLLWNAFSPSLEKPKQKAQLKVKIDTIVAKNGGQTVGHLIVELNKEGFYRN